MINQSDSLLQQMSSPTPFSMDESMSIKTENTNCNCSHAQIDSLITQKVINPIDLAIMKLLASHRYVNTFNINYAMQKILPPPYQKDSYHSNLKKLCRAGILIRHCIVYDSNDRCCTPLRFYSLSPGAYSYLQPMVTHPHGNFSAANDRMVLEDLTLNQFMIRLRYDYSDNVRYISTHIAKKSGIRNFTIDAFVRYALHHGPLDSISIFIFSSRSFMEGIADVSERVCLFTRWLDRHQDEHPNYMIIILTEHIRNIPILYNAVRAKETPVNYPLYFCTDTALLGDSVFKCLYTCTTESGIVDIKRQSIDL